MNTPDNKSHLKKVLFTYDNGEEVEIIISPKVHFLSGFAASDLAAENKVRMEVIMAGKGGVLGEIFFQMGKQRPELINHCVLRLAGKAVERLEAKAKEAGVDLQDEILKNLPTKGGVC